MQSLPAEIKTRIFNFVPRSAHITWRLLNRHFENFFWMEKTLLDLGTEADVGAISRGISQEVLPLCKRVALDVQSYQTVWMAYLALDKSGIKPRDVQMYSGGASDGGLDALMLCLAPLLSVSCKTLLIHPLHSKDFLIKVLCPFSFLTTLVVYQPEDSGWGPSSSNFSQPLLFPNLDTLTMITRSLYRERHTLVRQFGQLVVAPSLKHLTVFGGLEGGMFDILSTWSSCSSIQIADDNAPEVELHAVADRTLTAFKNLATLWVDIMWLGIVKNVELPTSLREIGVEASVDRAYEEGWDIEVVQNACPPERIIKCAVRGGNLNCPVFKIKLGRVLKKEIEQVALSDFPAVKGWGAQ